MKPLFWAIRECGGLSEAGSTQSWEVLEVEEGDGHMAPAGMQLKPSLWTLAHTKGTYQSQELAGQALGLPCCL